MSRNQSRAGSVYELFASLGLDVTALDAGLAQSKIKLDALQNPIRDAVMMLDQLGKAMGPQALSLMMDQLQAKTKLFAGEIQQLHTIASNVAAGGQPVVSDPRSLITTDTDIVNKLTANAELQRVDLERKSLERESLNETKRIAAQRKAERLREAASDREYVNLKKQLGAEVAAADRAQQVADSRNFDIEMNAHRDRRIKRRAASKDSAMEARLQARSDRDSRMDNLGGGMGPGGIGAEIRTSFYMGGIAQLLGMEIPMGLTSVLARLEPLQRAMHLAFPVLAVTGFLSILSAVSKKLGEVSDEMRGLDATSRATWKAMAEGVRDTVMKGLEVREMLRSINEAGLRGKELHIEQGKNAKEELVDIQNQIDSRADLISKLAMNLEMQKAITSGVNTRVYLELMEKLGGKKFFAVAEDARESIIRYGDITKAVEGLNTELTTNRQLLTDLNDKKGRISAEEQRRALQAERDRTKQDRLRDRVHELPWRLPWFMGENPSDFFMKSLEGAPARRRNFIPGPPKMQRGDPTIPREGDGNPLGDRAGLRVEQHFHIDQKFDGVPSNMEQIVRDRITPQLIKDLGGNQRMAMDDLVASLRRAGVQVV